MKKILSILAVMLLLIGAIGVTLDVRPEVKAGVMYHLDVYTNPSFIPINGTGDYPEGTYVELQALDEYVVDDTKYVFQNWTIDGVYAGTTNPYKWVYMNKDRNATANYKTQHKFTVVTQYDTAWIWDGDSWETEGDQDISLWIDEGTTVKAGLSTGLVEITPPSGWWAYADFQNWLGDVSGLGDHTTNPQHSSTVVMNGPKSASTNWTVNYYLWTPDSIYQPWGWPSHIYNPGMSGYRLNCTVVDITAPEICPNSINPNHWRWRFDHWIVQKWNGTAWDPTTITDRTIHIHMGQPTIATIHFWLQYYLTFNDDIGGLSCLSTFSGYYDYCTTYEFTANATVPVAQDMQWRWAFWKENGVFFSSNRTIKYHVTNEATLTGCYHLQYYVRLDTDPRVAPAVEIQGTGISGPPPIGGWFDSGATIKFIAPDVAEFVAGDHKWVFDSRWEPGAYKCWWKNGFPWGQGEWYNASHRSGTLGTLTGPTNITAWYRKYYYLEWDTDPTGLSDPHGVWKGFAWLPEGYTFWTGAPPGWYNPSWVFKQLFEDGVSKGVGVFSYLCTMDRAHTIIAEYVNKTTFYIVSPPPFTAPKECTNFDVTVWAANFDAERGRDLYAMDFRIKWNSTLINLVKDDYKTYLDDLWGVGKWFVAKNETWYDGTWDYYWFAATALKPAAGFCGSKPIVKLTFHIKLDPCYPKVYESPIAFTEITLTNSTNHVIKPELTYGASYSISAPKPIVLIELSKTPIRRNVPQETFDAYVKIKLGIKVTDFNVTICYPRLLIEPVNVTFGDYLPGPAFISRGYIFDKATGKIMVWAEQDPEQSPHAYGNGTLFVIEFKVINATFWPNDPLTGDIKFDGSKSYLSVCCPWPKKQYFNPDVEVDDVPYIYDPLPGDLNFDGVVNICDLRMLADKYGTYVGLPPYKEYDLTGDGFVWLRDLVLVALHFGDHI